jgi:hypothetical protein
MIGAVRFGTTTIAFGDLLTLYFQRGLKIIATRKMLQNRWLGCLFTIEPKEPLQDRNQ